MKMKWKVKTENEMDDIKALYVNDVYEWDEQKKIIPNKKQMLRDIRNEYSLTQKQIKELKEYIEALEETYQEWK